MFILDWPKSNCILFVCELFIASKNFINILIILLDYFLRSFRQLHDSAFKKSCYSFRQEKFKISSPVVKFGKPILTFRLLHRTCQIIFHELPFRIWYSTIWRKSEAKYELPVWFFILKSTPNKQSLTRSCAFVFQNKLEQSGIRLHDGFAV